MAIPVFPLNPSSASARWEEAELGAREGKGREFCSLSFPSVLGRRRQRGPGLGEPGEGQGLGGSREWRWGCRGWR